MLLPVQWGYGISVYITLYRKLDFCIPGCGSVAGIKKGDTNISENQGGPRVMDLKANNGDINIRFNG